MDDDEYVEKFISELKLIYATYKPPGKNNYSDIIVALSENRMTFLVNSEEEFLEYFKPFIEYSKTVNDRDLPFMNEDKSSGIFKRCVKFMGSCPFSDKDGIRIDYRKSKLFCDLKWEWSVCCAKIVKNLKEVFDRDFESLDESMDFFEKIHKIRLGFMRHMYEFKYMMYNFITLF